MSALLSVLIPAYNEESTIPELLRRVLAVDLERLGIELEVIACDDGSSDDTRACIAKVASAERRVTLVWHDVNRGKSAAIRTALAHASGHYCLIQDGDLEYDPGDYPALLTAALRGASVVYGSRFLANRYPSRMRPSHYLANRLLTLTANTLFHVGITDEATCIKLFRTKLLRDLDLSSEGFDFCPEVTAKLGLRGVRIVEVPVWYRARTNGDGKKIRWTDGIGAMWTLIKHRVGRG